MGIETKRVLQNKSKLNNSTQFVSMIGSYWERRAVGWIALQLNKFLTNGMDRVDVLESATIEKKSVICNVANRLSYESVCTSPPIASV